MTCAQKRKISSWIKLLEKLLNFEKYIVEIIKKRKKKKKSVKWEKIEKGK